MKKIKNSNKGFTLLELLVVVLIIGILAAIALPQYKKAVAKAELAQIISLTRAVKESEEVYYLANGKYGEIDKLDVSVNDSDVICSLEFSALISCTNKNFKILYYLRNSGESSGWFTCYVNTDDKNSARVNACKDFFKVQSGQIISGHITENCNFFSNSKCYSISGWINSMK